MADREPITEPGRPAGGESGLPARRERFVAEYLRDLNATQAAVRAGYSSKTAVHIGYQLLRVPEVRDAIDRGKRQLMESLQAEAFQVVRELAIIAFSDITTYRIDPATGEVSVPEGCEEETRALRLVRRRLKHGPGGAEAEVELALWDKLEALKLLGQYLGLGQGGGAGSDQPAYKVYVQVDPASDV